MSRYWRLEEDQRQLMIRALAVQALSSPGFFDACERSAAQLDGNLIFDEFYRLLKDAIQPEVR